VTNVEALFTRCVNQPYQKEKSMTVIDNNTMSELREAELDAIAGGLAVVKSLGVCTGCTTIYLPTPWNPNP